jgi:disulfide bond formation protein DsbB
MPNPIALIFGSSRHLALAALALGLATIIGAFGFQYIGGYLPCELCYQQRVPYYAGLPVLAALVIAWPIPPRMLKLIGLLISAGIFVYSAYLGIYHAGVEWGFLPGPTACTGVGEVGGFDALSNLDASAVVPCDRAQWRFLGISFAGYNGLISLAISAFAICGILRLIRVEKAA